MKQLDAVFIFFAMFIVGLFMVCVYPSTPAPVINEVQEPAMNAFHKTKWQGHVYVTNYKSFLHDPDCPCNLKK